MAMEALLRVVKAPILLREPAFLEEVCKHCHAAAPSEPDKRKAWVTVLSQIANTAVKQLTLSESTVGSAPAELEGSRLSASCIAIVALHRLVQLDCIGLVLDRLLAQAVSALGPSHANVVSRMCIHCLRALLAGRTAH